MDHEVLEKLTVLAVDDDLTMLKIVEDFLDDEYRVSLAKSGAEAIKLLERGLRPDLVLLDVAMPGLDGYETLKQIRGIDPKRHLPVIFISGTPDKSNEPKCLDSGAEDFVWKPLNKAALRARIQARLRRPANDLREELARNLTPSERKIMNLMAAGYTNMDISLELHYSYGYIKKTAALVLNKLELDRSALRRMFASLPAQS
ncbi:MAG: response regulator [Clostridiales bacterium]|jgi:DNA-binding response OmpR family regulator|nr:response regulator [Clostridiales bacterium]